MDEGMDEAMEHRLLGRIAAAGTSLLPLAAMAPRAVARALEEQRWRPYRVLTPHEAAVIDAATRRIAPGADEVRAAGPDAGALEPDVARYVDTVLALFIGHDQLPGGPAALWPPASVGGDVWRRRVDGLRADYRAGVALLDGLARGDFTAAPPPRQDQILACDPAASFFALLFQHTIESLYANPDCRSRRDRLGWQDSGHRDEGAAVATAEREFAVLGTPSVFAQLFAWSDGAAPRAGDLRRVLSAA